MKRYYVEGIGVHLPPLAFAVAVSLGADGHGVVTFVSLGLLLVFAWRRWTANIVTDEYVVGQGTVDGFLTNAKVRLDEVRATSRTRKSLLWGSDLVIKDKNGTECAITSLAALKDPRIASLIAQMPPTTEEQ